MRHEQSLLGAVSDSLIAFAAITVVVPAVSLLAAALIVAADVAIVGVMTAAALTPAAATVGDRYRLERSRTRCCSVSVE